MKGFLICLFIIQNIIVNSYYLRGVALDYLPPANMTGNGIFIRYTKDGERIEETVEEVNKKFFEKYLK
jgi:hypothetical protein